MVQNIENWSDTTTYVCILDIIPGIFENMALGNVKLGFRNFNS